jgi:hypothetical protein
VSADLRVEFVGKLAECLGYCVNCLPCCLALLVLFSEFVTHDAANLLFLFCCHCASFGSFVLLSLY